MSFAADLRNLTKGRMSILIFVVAATLIISAACSLYEAVLYSMRIATLEVRAKTSPLAARALKMKKNISEPVSAILVLNTVANTAGATVAGMYAAKVFGERNVIVFSLVLTVCILFLSEILPKTVGAIYWRTFWPAIVWPITVIKWGLYPIVKLAQAFANLFTGDNTAAPITEAEIKALVRMGAKAGEISRTESEWVHNLIELEDKPVRMLMTPRTVVFKVSSGRSVSDVLTIAKDKGFTRIPIHDENPENIIGYITMLELTRISDSGKGHVPVGYYKRNISMVPGTLNAFRFIMTMLAKKQHIAAVVDEYGGLDGILTLEDVIETILGSEILDEKDTIEDMQQHAKEVNKEKLETGSSID